MAKHTERLADIVEDAVRRKYKRRGHLARAIGMKDSAFSQAIQGSGRLSIPNCLKLANELGLTPTAVLRMAGHPEIAATLDDLIGRAEHKYTRREREHMKLWRTITNPSVHDAIDALLTNSARQAPATTGTTGPRALPTKTPTRRLAGTPSTTDREMRV